MTDNGLNFIPIGWLVLKLYKLNENAIIWLVVLVLISFCSLVTPSLQRGQEIRRLLVIDDERQDTVARGGPAVTISTIFGNVMNNYGYYQAVAFVGLFVATIGHTLLKTFEFALSLSIESGFNEDTVIVDEFDTNINVLLIAPSILAITTCNGNNVTAIDCDTGERWTSCK